MDAGGGSSPGLQAAEVHLPAAVHVYEAAEVTLTASQASKASLWSRLPFHQEHFCDVSLRSTDGETFKAHRLVLSMASDPLFAMLSGDFAEGHQSEVPFESSSETLGAFLEFLYNGSTKVKTNVIPELLRLVHQWEVQPLRSALNEQLLKHMTPELCSSLIIDCEALLVDDLDEMLERYVLQNFAACVKADQFGSWPLHRMIGLLRSDDLEVSNEEEVLAAVMHWHRTAPGRDDATAALLQMVRFPLLSMATLQALLSRQGLGLTGLPGVVMSRLAAAGMKWHTRAPRDTELDIALREPRRRRVFPYWWADVGCSIRGATVVAERGFDVNEIVNAPADEHGELEPWAVHVYDSSMYIIDGREPCCVLQWPLGGTSGRVIVGSGSTLNGVNHFTDILDIAIDCNGDLFVLDGTNHRIVRIRDGVGQVVGDGSLSLDGTRALYIGADGAIYFIDDGGSRVQRYANGVTTRMAGGTKPGSGPDQLEDAEDIFVTRDGTLYISDSGNHRIQKWLPGASEGTTVAGGNGEGCREDQLYHPVGLFVTEEGFIYIADYQNHRVMKWFEGWSAGLVVAGGQPGPGLHQLCEPIDVTMDSTGALYIADNGNSRVVRWAAPSHPYENMIACPF